MKEWSIITDSSCDLKMNTSNEDNIHFAKVPFIIRVDQKDYIDTETINIDLMLDEMEKSPELSMTACPAPGPWYELFEKGDMIIAITISEKLSGSFNSANVAKDMILEKYPEKKIFILNSKSAGSALTMCVNKAIECIRSQMDFDTVVERLKQYSDERRTIFVLSSFNNLIKSGRIKKLIGLLANKLGICGIGAATSDGEIIFKDKKRGVHKVISSFIDDMKEHRFNGGTVVISHCKNIELAGQLEEKIKQTWKTANVLIMPTGGLCSFYVERNGVIVAY